ncbi:MAG: endonuclease III [Dehalococcoidales bacterium]
MAATKPPAQAAEVIAKLENEYPGASIALKHSGPLELLVATILSAQATDVGVNKVTPGLFRKYRTTADYANADREQFEQEIRSTGFYRNKAKNIINAARMLLDNFGGQVPRTMTELVTLPGVARKTANIVLYNAYGVIDGIVVDTHVGRLAQRLGLSAYKDPVKIERDLMKQVLRRKWGRFSYLLIDHGRAVCMARKPKCDICLLNDICPSAFTFYPVSKVTKAR